MVGEKWTGQIEGAHSVRPATDARQRVVAGGSKDQPAPPRQW